MKNFLSSKKKKALISAVAAGICFSGIFLPESAEAVEQFNIDWGGKTLFNVKYYGASDYTDSRAAFFQMYTSSSVLNYDLTSNIKSGLNKAFKWWAEILGPGANISQPAQYFVGTYNDQNAAADSQSYKNGINTKNPDLFSAIFQSGQTVTQFNNVEDIVVNMKNFQELLSNDDTAFGHIYIGQYLAPDILNDGGYGFLTSEYYASPTPELIIGADISAVMFHEIGHSLGIGAGVLAANGTTWPGKDYYVAKFKDFDEKSFTAHLYNQNGEQAKPNATILASADDVSAVQQYVAENHVPGKDFDPENIFVVDNNSEAKNSGKIYLYFAGENVTEALDGKTFTRGDGQQVSGIPVNLWENGAPEFGHIELERSMMSHQLYRSYVNFMEAELAALQDIGYNIDRRNFYGRSIYNDGLTLTNYQGYSARENGEYVDGYNNSTYGIGLHVYGSNNNITQAGNIFSNGAGAVGVRVDGVNNTITVAKDTEIHADGSDSDGVLIAYGKNHNVNIEGTVTATGESGNALSFNFGSNSLGTNMEYRGSFMRYLRANLGNNIVTAKNLGLNELFHGNDVWSFSDKENGDLNAPMVNTVNISGKLIANPDNYGKAIYIDMTSFVDTININDGAEIIGGIMSQWKHFDPSFGFYDNETPYESGVKGSDGNILTDKNGNPYTIDGLKLQYNGGNYLYTKYIPDLVTKLNFNNTMAYSGDIWGYDNMKMNVNGNLLYGGSANVVNVNVAEGAALFGGNFTVNDMSDKIAENFSDDTTGKFYNHGTIGNLKITGNLVSDGVLTEGIEVSGNANVEGSTVKVRDAMPGEVEVLTANSITGNLKNSTEKISGMLSSNAKIEGTKLIANVEVTNNLSGLNSSQSQAFDAIKNMSANSTDNSLRAVLNFDEETAKTALSEIGSADATYMISSAQQNSVTNRIISDRLLTELTEENDVWIKFTKNWGELKGGANYHGQAISGGYDKKFGENWRGGLFVSYNSTSLSPEKSSGSIYDTRFGIYGGFHKDVDDLFMYIDGGKIRNRFERNISSLGLSTDAKYNSNIFEIGCEYKRNLTPDKNYSLSPYINLQYSRLKQNAYDEEGAGIFNQHVDSKTNNYFAGQLGVEFKRKFTKGNYAARIGIKHAFTGANPELSFSYEGDANTFYKMKNNQNKTHFVMSLSGENEFANGWVLGGDLAFQKGSHDKDLSASIMLRKVW